MNYRVEIIEKKNPVKQSEASRSSIKDLLSDLLNEAKVPNNAKSHIKKMEKLNLDQITSIEQRKQC